MTHLKSAKRITKLLDSQFNILGYKFGLEPLIGLVPGLGDIITVVLSLYLVFIGFQMHLPRKEIVRMLFNIGLDFLIGTIPVVGDISDFFYKANERNMRILERFSGPEEGKVME